MRIHARQENKDTWDIFTTTPQQFDQIIEYCIDNEIFAEFKIIDNNKIYFFDWFKLRIVPADEYNSLFGYL